MTSVSTHSLVAGAGTADDAANWIRDADRIIFAAGAGLSAAAGYDYTDTADFQTLFPAMVRLGFTARYQLIGQPLPDRLFWGYWAAHVRNIRLGTTPNPLYTSLRSLAGDRPHAVFTSNVDALFARNGFDTPATYTPQGDYALYQCLTPCTRQVWDARPIIDAILMDYDPTTGMTSEQAVPSCPNCGGKVHLNVHAGPWYINDHFQPGLHALNAFLEDTLRIGATLTIVEVGAGFNTPGVIRWPAENIARRVPGTHLVRINHDHPGVPTELASQSASIAGDTDVFLSRLNAPVT